MTHLLPSPVLRKFRSGIVMLTIAMATTACAVLPSADQPVVSVVGLQAMKSEGMELRFGMKLRVLNPTEKPIEFNGLSVKLDLDGQGLANGVSQQSGTIDRFGEQLIDIPVTISLFSALRQALRQANRADASAVFDGIAYSLSGRFGGTGFNALRFSNTGTLSIGNPSEKAAKSR